MSRNKALHTANKNKEDEFYTKISDIEKELKHYKIHFKNKTIFCNCDDPEYSNFWKYFKLNFEYLNLNKLITTHYSKNGQSYKLELEKVIDNSGELILKTTKTILDGNGDFRNDECIEILKESDIVVTNPPFSLFRDYVSKLIRYNKKFIIIGNQNAITYKEIFHLIKENKIWLGYNNGEMEFIVPSYYEPRKTRFRIDENGIKYRSLGNICWFTNLDISKRHEDLILYKTYTKDDYDTYDNYNGINVNKVDEIPIDYNGVMGVPITFLHKYNPEQFEIIHFRKGEDGRDLSIDGKCPYFRILIKKRK